MSQAGHPQPVGGENRTRRLLKAIDWMCVCIALVSIVVLVLFFIWVDGVTIDEETPPIVIHFQSFALRFIPGLVSVCVLFIASYIALRKIQQIKSEEEQSQLALRLSQAVGDYLAPIVGKFWDIEYASRGIEIHEFDSIRDAYDHVANKLLSAKESVADITWGSFTGYRTAQEEAAYKNYVQAIHTVCAKGSIVYQEVSSLSDEHYCLRAVELFPYYSYHLGYHDISTVKVPLMSYIIIDSEEVIAGFTRIPGKEQPLEGITYLSVRQPMIVSFFRNNFGFIWDTSEKLKEANKISEKKVVDIKRRLGLRDD